MFRDAIAKTYCIILSYCIALLSDRVFVQIAILGSLEVSNMINDHEHRNGSDNVEEDHGKCVDRMWGFPCPSWRTGG